MRVIRCCGLAEAGPGTQEGAACSWSLPCPGIGCQDMHCSKEAAIRNAFVKLFLGKRNS